MGIVLAPGACIRNQLDPNYAGTLGCFVRSQTDPEALYLLTAGHVINRYGYAAPGEQIAMFHQGGWVAIGRFERSTRFRDMPGAIHQCDAAIARVILPSDASVETTLAIPGIGVPTGVAADLNPAMRLRFNGAGTEGVGSGRIESTGNYTPVYYVDNVTGQGYVLNYRNQIVYGSNTGGDWRPCTVGRDSGALLIADDGSAVGLHVGVTDPTYPVSASICSPLQFVLDELNVALPSPATAPSTRDFDQLGIDSDALFGTSVRGMLEPHNYQGGASWRLTPRGVLVAGNLDRTPGEPLTVRRVWRLFGEHIRRAALAQRVPIELIVATICTETRGDPSLVYFESGWTSDEQNPGRVSVGLMQTLISTAREVAAAPGLDRNALLDAATSIDIGTACIARKRKITQYDPPLVASVYNHGSLSGSTGNRWHMIHTNDHADRFVAWFNDCMACAPEFNLPTQVPSFSSLFQ